MATKTSMQYVRLGKSGLKVSKIILGCMGYGSKNWQDWVLDEAESIEQIKAAYALGINTFNTANIYSDGESEVVLGKAIKAIGAPRSSFVIMTKINGEVWPKELAKVRKDGDNLESFGLVNAKGLSRKHIFEGVQASLQRLQLDYVDVLQCHRLDPDTPIEEIMHALHDVVKAGYARYIGISSCHAWQFHVMQNYAINNGLTPFISMQNYHSLLYREEEREMNQVCKHFGVGTIPWSPLTKGYLARPRANYGDTLRSKTDPWTSLIQTEDDPNLVIVDRVEEVAKKRGISMTQVALAWLMAKEPVSAPVVGTTTLHHLEDMIAAIHVKLDEEETKYLEELYTPKTVVGF